MFNHSAQAMDSGSDESSLDEDESERIDEKNLSSKDDQSDEEIRLAEEEDDDDDDDAIETIKTNFNGIKIHDHIQPSMNDSYFKVDINGHRKFIHKQSACWLLTDRNNHLSNDRLSRVIQTSRKENSNPF